MRVLVVLVSMVFDEVDSRLHGTDAHAFRRPFDTVPAEEPVVELLCGLTHVQAGVELPLPVELACRVDDAELASEVPHIVCVGLTLPACHNTLELALEGVERVVQRPAANKDTQRVDHLTEQAHGKQAHVLVDDDA